MGDQKRGFLEGRDQHVGQFCDWLSVDDAQVDCLLDLLVNEGNAVVLLYSAQRLPTEHDRAVDEHDSLHLGLQCSFEEAVQPRTQLLPGICTGRGRRERAQCEIAFNLLEDGTKQLRLVPEVVIERAPRTDAGCGDQIADARVEITFRNEYLAARVDEVASRLVTACPAFVIGAASFRHACIVATFVMYVARMADDAIRAYGSVAPLKVGLLNDYPTSGTIDNDTVAAMELVFDEMLATGLVDRPIELVHRNCIGLPNGTYHSVERAFDELADEGCLAIFGPWISDNVVPLRAHVDAAAKVPIVTLSGSEGALGEWCFALNNGSMAEEPVMLAAVLLGDGRSRIAIAYEASLIGKEYLSFAEKAYTTAGLKVVTTIAIPQVEADKADAVVALRQADPDALVHVGFGHGLWGFSDALLSAGWDPPRYTTTAFEMAHISGEWMHHIRGWIGLDSYDERNPVGQAFLDRFETRYGRRPGHSMPGLSHDAATVIARGLSAARPLTGAGVRDGIEQVKLIPAASGAPGTFLRFGRHIRQGWLGSDYLIARRVLPDGSGHVFHAAPSDNIARAVGSVSR